MFTNKCTEGSESKVMGDKLCGATKPLKPLAPIKTGKDRSVLTNLLGRRTQK